MQAQLGRHENILLKQNKTNIQLENHKLKETLKTALCTKCNGSLNPSDYNSVEEYRLRLQIHRLTEELSKMTALAQRCLGRPIMSFDLSNSAPIGQVPAAPPLPPVMPTISLAGVLDVSQNQIENSPFLELAEKAMEELTKLVSVNAPLWTQTGCEGGGGGAVEYLNLEEYIKSFPPCFETKPDKNSTRYATRASGIVAAKSSSILNSLMNEAGNRNLQMMDAELQALSPIVPVWKVKFLRFCRQIAEGVWGMVDVSIETSGIVNCRRFPSGCVLQDILNGCSRVTWVEHLDCEENDVKVIHPLGVMSCSSSFGAQRWLASLQRQCLCLAIISSPPASTQDRASGMVSHFTKRSMVSMAHRMVRSFGFGLCSTVHQWQLVQAGETRLTVRNNMDNPGEPTGVVVCATNSVWMPLSHLRVFDFLSNKDRRGEWEDVHYTMPIQELARIDKSNDDELNRVSFLHTTVLIDKNNQKVVPIVQETQSDESGSMIVYGMVNLPVMQVVMSGQDSSSVEILPNGFSIIPNIKRPATRECVKEEDDSCMMTVAFQILTKNSPGNMNISMELIEYINNLMSQRIQRIRSALHCG
ncbi:homeobox-leucine zipper protein HDG1-like [Impatiens glandulifera]|uniref:homeobox-leucine zipper protein HDG1-like n=1 Tax=Impatiens glandulifera TaxID=253017 RepID=UPI001FB1003A|nr:homeobox-leucine zipper protein HDG1-like [Impatiens glandulifera]